METYPVSGVSPDMSFLEMMDMLNDQIIRDGGDPVAFDHDCREGICGMCSMFINGEAHGPGRGVTTCQLHMRSFKDGDSITIEPWRASAFPVVKDLAVDRSAFDRIIQSGGYISVNTSGETLDANAIPVPKPQADEAFSAATCIGCGGVRSVMQECLGDVICICQGLAVCAVATRPAGTIFPRQAHGGSDGPGRFR